MIMVNAKVALVFVSLGAFAYLQTSQGYGTGAPVEVCDDMLPQHGPPSQTGPSPYSLTINRKSVKPGETLSLTLSAKDGTKFQGFLIHARDITTGKPVGWFQPLPANKSQKEFKGKWKLITCPNGASNNTATHNDSVEKSRVVLTWIAPRDLKNSFKFKYTVAKNGGEYWVAKESESITMSAANAPSKL
ncbi:putative defense protein Hdd11 [Daktulosphaira vitifoliae]|uniref:putative defense protein Hdd11 n=1 Tax=Daktulosphaira vitifoliae TaxID=58002 RepID=UPI0021A9B1AD|nr:putative defense protein Hdd11 [Daktulosphaira vitifoliae]